MPEHEARINDMFKGLTALEGLAWDRGWRAATAQIAALQGDPADSHHTVRSILQRMVQADGLPTSTYCWWCSANIHGEPAESHHEDCLWLEAHTALEADEPPITDVTAERDVAHLAAQPVSYATTTDHYRLAKVQVLCEEWEDIARRRASGQQTRALMPFEVIGNCAQCLRALLTAAPPAENEPT